MKLIIFEDDKFDLLFPLSMMRPVYDIKPGVNSVLEKCIATAKMPKSKIILHCRESLSNLKSQRYKYAINQFADEDYLLLNGRFMYEGKFLNELQNSTPQDKVLVHKDSIVAAYITKQRSSVLQKSKGNSENVLSAHFFEGAGFEIVESGSEGYQELKYPWDVVSYSLKAGIAEDLRKYSVKGKTVGHKNSVKPKSVTISSKANVSPTSVLDASEGRVVVDSGAVIEPFAYIKGPAYIGKNTLVKSGAKIYGPCFIGNNSKVAGEIAESVFHSYVNKQHDGFIGHSYICPFVNLGADTVTSDLKNNYSTIRENFRGGNIDTGMMFLGSILGDHTKTSINTMLNTGTIAGIFANIFGGGFPSKSIGSFAWYETGKKPEKYAFEKAIETARIVMLRRGIEMSDQYVELAKSYFEEAGD